MSEAVTRPRHRYKETFRSLTADLEALGWNRDYRQSSRLALTLEALVGELAALTEMADGNTSTATDRINRPGTLPHEKPIPSFMPAEAAARLEKAEQRLWREYERLASDVRRPVSKERAKCSQCRKRVRLVDEFCGPCGAAILKAHRRRVNND